MDKLRKCWSAHLEKEAQYVGDCASLDALIENHGSEPPSQEFLTAMVTITSNFFDYQQSFRANFMDHSVDKLCTFCSSILVWIDNADVGNVILSPPQLTALGTFCKALLTLRPSNCAYAAYASKIKKVTAVQGAINLKADVMSRFENLLSDVGTVKNLDSLSNALSLTCGVDLAAHAPGIESSLSQFFKDSGMDCLRLLEYAHAVKILENVHIVVQAGKLHQWERAVSFLLAQTAAERLVIKWTALAATNKEAVLCDDSDSIFLDLQRARKLLEIRIKKVDDVTQMAFKEFLDTDILTKVATMVEEIGTCLLEKADATLKTEAAALAAKVGVGEDFGITWTKGTNTVDAAFKATGVLVAENLKGAIDTFNKAFGFVIWMFVFMMVSTRARLRRSCGFPWSMLPSQA